MGYGRSSDNIEMDKETLAQIIQRGTAALQAAHPSMNLRGIKPCDKVEEAAAPEEKTRNISSTTEAGDDISTTSRRRLNERQAASVQRELQKAECVDVGAECGKNIKCCGKIKCCDNTHICDDVCEAPTTTTSLPTSPVSLSLCSFVAHVLWRHRLKRVLLHHHRFSIFSAHLVSFLLLIPRQPVQLRQPLQLLVPTVGATMEGAQATKKHFP